MTQGFELEWTPRIGDLVIRNDSTFVVIGFAPPPENDVDSIGMDHFAMTGLERKWRMSWLHDYEKVVR